MPLVALDELPNLIQRHPRYSFLSQDPQKVLPESTYELLALVKVPHLWQLLSFSGRELTDQMRALGVPYEKHNIWLGDLTRSLLGHGFAPRENTPFAIRVERKPPVYIRALSENTKTFTEYAEATYYWNRWAGAKAQLKLANSISEKMKLVFRTESLKLGYDITRP